ncbi:MAG: FKBP-type peptidyl-prolyl cis-trans isomerase [Gammaproteobacteria bacterium]|jgi:peptidylprolyl isomerase
MRRRTRWMSLQILCLLVSGFITNAGAETAFNKARGGLRFQEIAIGQGPTAQTGDVVTMHFTGWLQEQGVRGAPIFNSRAQGRPVRFVVGADGVMSGWNIGVEGMRSGGERLLLVPPGLAYGERAIEGVVPENASLMFRIEVIAVEPL